MTVPSGVSVYLIVNSVPLDTYAWRCLDYSDLLNGPAIRGNDRLFPSAPGRRAVKRKVDATTVSLSMHVFGYKAQDGSAIAAPLEGLMTHRAYLRANLGLGLSTGNGTVAVTFKRGSLADLTGSVTVLAIADWQTINGREATFRLDLSIPAGELA